MSHKSRVLRTRRKRRSEKGRKHGPNRGSRHKSPSGRTGQVQHKKTRSKQAFAYVSKEPLSLGHLWVYCC